MEGKKFTPVRDVILKKAFVEYGEANLYGEEGEDVVVNPNVDIKHFPWRYSYNLETEEDRVREQEEMDRFYCELYHKIMHERFDGETCACFEKIYIATTNFCNGKCNFCPAGNDKNHRAVYLADTIIDKLIKELREMSFTGKISLHGVNEPLLDKRIVSICKKFKDNLPSCRLQLLTNGSMLTIDLLDELVRVTDKIDVHIYTDSLEVPTIYDPIIEYCNTNDGAKQVVKFFIRRQNEILSQKGYGPCGRNISANIKSGCIMPFTTLSVLATGDISYCDSDYLGKGAMGNIAESSILEIWNNKKFNEYRKHMILGRKHTKFCEKCDFF